MAPMKPGGRFAWRTKYGATVIKTCATGRRPFFGRCCDTPQLTQAERDALVDEAHALKLKAAAQRARQ